LPFPCRLGGNNLKAHATQTRTKEQDQACAGR
jgi:hypothetical protein